MPDTQIAPWRQGRRHGHSKEGDYTERRTYEGTPRIPDSFRGMRRYVCGHRLQVIEVERRHQHLTRPSAEGSKCEC